MGNETDFSTLASQFAFSLKNPGAQITKLMLVISSQATSSRSSLFTGSFGLGGQNIGQKMLENKSYQELVSNLK